jgi:hypothetical protein
MYCNLNDDENNKQELIIMDKVNDCTEMDKNFTSSESVLASLMVFKDTPIKLVRRAVKSLVKKGLLLYTGDEREGLYGRNESIFKLNTKTD